MIYLASPYTHIDPAVMEQRFHAACRAAGHLMRKGEIVFSPIAHTHPIAVSCELPRGWDYWARFDREFIQASSEVMVLTIPGWQESRGVTAELAIAREAGIRVSWMDPDVLESEEPMDRQGPKDRAVEG